MISSMFSLLDLFSKCDQIPYENHMTTIWKLIILMSGTCFAYGKYVFFNYFYIKFQLIVFFLECALGARESNFGIYINFSMTKVPII